MRMTASARMRSRAGWRRRSCWAGSSCSSEALEPSPVLEAMGKTIVHAGGAGNGQAAKICNNMILGATMIATCEAFLLAKKLGLDLQTFYDISSKASGQSWSMTSYCPVPGVGPETPADRGYEGGFAAALMLKDLKLAMEAAQEAISSPLLDNISISGATGVLVNITGGQDLTLGEVHQINEIIHDAVGDDAEIIFGAVHEPAMQGEIRVTVIATVEGKVFINPTGNPGMASGGMGDVLAGILTALLGQGFSPDDAMKLGVYLHGFVGDRVAAEKGQIGLIASDIIDGLPAGIGALAAPIP